MNFGFLNAIMLAGLAALVLPIIVHLISKRRFDVVDWGAMQFLELGRRMRRRVRLQDLLLMALRMALLGLLALGMARPWASGGFLQAFSPNDPRDIAIVIDGSYSMNWEGLGVTPRSSAIQRAHEILDACRPGDTVTLIDAREQPERVAGTPTSDLTFVRRALDTLPPATGTSDLAAAAADAVQTLAFTTNAKRHVVVLTDGQALPWLPANSSAWTNCDDLRRQLPIPLQMFAIDVTDGAVEADGNVFVDPLLLSRELAVPDFPVRIRTTLRQSGPEPIERKAWLELNGQRLDETTQTVTVPPHGRAPVEFEHRFAAAGSYVATVAIDQDDLPSDDRSPAALLVDQGLPVLLIDGDPQLDPVQSETFFLKAAFSPADNQAPWVIAETISGTGWSETDLQGRAVVFLCNVPRLDARQRAALKQFVTAGGGLVIAPGDRVDPANYAQAVEEGLLPYALTQQKHEGDFTLSPILFDPESLEAGWLSRFRTSTGTDLAQTRFATWWGLEAPERPADAAPPEAGQAPGAGDDATGISSARVEAQLKTIDPVIVSGTLGRGAVVMLAIPLDADWSTLPTRSDFVPFVHELVFALISGTHERNVSVGDALRLTLQAGESPREWTFIGPDGSRTPGRSPGIGRQEVELRAARFAGIYEAVFADDPERSEFFVAAADRRESDLSGLDPQLAQQLQQDHGLQFVSGTTDYQETTRTEPGPVELWRWLLLTALAMLVLETVMTRRLVLRGRLDLESDAAATSAQVVA